MKTTILSTNCIHRSLGRPALLLFSLLIGCLGLLPEAQAVSPPPDGGYPGFTTAEGQNALKNLTTGQGNTGLGWFSLFSASTGNFNTSVGAGALALNTGDSNTATGAVALLLNTTGSQNTATGTAALLHNSTGSNNTAVGYQVLLNNISGNFNTANGDFALSNNAAGDFNTAIGYGALTFNINGSRNTASGYGALNTNSSGSDNTAAGNFALSNNSTGSGNIAVGASAGSNVATASGVICVGHPGADVSNTTWMSNIYGVTTQSGTTAPVIVSDGGQLGTVASSERFKKDIVSMDRASEVILSLRPVAFHYKTDAKETPQFGLVAEEVAKVNPALVLPDKEGKPYSVRYDAVNAMLLNEFLKEHKNTEKLEATVASLIATVKEQAAQIQKVSAQLEASKPAPQVVNNNQ